MLTLKRIAVTGSIASGKSTVCQFFKQNGAEVVSADYLLHQVFTTDSAIGQAIVSLFGKKVITEGTINRTLIAEAVRSNPALLDQLEDICHPYVNQEIQREYQEASKKKTDDFFVVEIPLLFESRVSLTPWFDVVIAVVASEEQAKERYVRKGGTQEQFMFRRARQMRTEEMIKRSDFVLFNNGTVEQLAIEAQNIMNHLKKSQ